MYKLKKCATEIHPVAPFIGIRIQLISSSVAQTSFFFQPKNKASPSILTETIPSDMEFILILQ